MRAATVILLYLAAVFLGGALLAPWVHHGLQGAARLWPALTPLAEAPFHRVVNRCLLGLALLGLWPLLRGLGVRRWSDLGWRRHPQLRRDLALGFVLGWGGLALVAAVTLLTGARVWRTDHPAGELAGALARGLTAALVVAALEETLFRGGLFRGLRREGRFAFAAGLSAAVYAWVHFFERPPRPAEVGPWTGLATLGQMLRGFTDPALLVPGWFTLLLAGLILAYACERQGTLWLAAGLHAGWVFWLKLYGFLTAAGDPAWLAWAGTRKLHDGWLAFGVMAVTGAVLAAVLRARNAAAGPPEAGPPPKSKGDTCA
jgi:hypothetical protein